MLKSIKSAVCSKVVVVLLLINFLLLLQLFVGFVFSHSFEIVLKPLSHWTATVLRQLATDIGSGSQSSLETVASDS